jgi:hypothetical protein
MISGERDTMAPPDLRRQHLHSFSKLTQILLPGLDHGWTAKAKGPDSESIDALVLQSILDWQATVLGTHGYHQAPRA